MYKLMADRVTSCAQQGDLAKDTSPNRLATNTSLVIYAAKAMTAFQSSTDPDSSHLRLVAPAVRTCTYKIAPHPVVQ